MFGFKKKWWQVHEHVYFDKKVRKAIETVLSKTKSQIDKNEKIVVAAIDRGTYGFHTKAMQNSCFVKICYKHRGLSWFETDAKIDRVQRMGFQFHVLDWDLSTLVLTGVLCPYDQVCWGDNSKGGPVLVGKNPREVSLEEFTQYVIDGIHMTLDGIKMSPENEYNMRELFSEDENRV